MEHRRDEAESRLRTSVERFGLSPQKAAGIARIKRSQGQQEAARIAYLEGIEAFPENFEILDDYILWLEQEGRPWEAITELRTRIGARSPGITDWLDSDATEEAGMEDVRTRVAEAPEVLAMIRRLSVLLMNHSQNEFELAEGVRYVEKTLEIAPENPFAFRALALGYAKQGRAGDAIEAMITSVRLEPDVPQLRQQLYDLLNASGRTMEAEAVARGEFP